MQVLVDKPIAPLVEQARELNAIATVNGLVLYAFQNRRWDSDFLALRHLLALHRSAPQSLGTVVEFESQYAPLSVILLNERIHITQASIDSGQA